MLFTSSVASTVSKSSDKVYFNGKLTFIQLNYFLMIYIRDVRVSFILLKVSLISGIYTEFLVTYKVIS